MSDWPVHQYGHFIRRMLYGDMSDRSSHHSDRLPAEREDRLRHGAECHNDRKVTCNRLDSLYWPKMEILRRRRISAGRTGSNMSPAIYIGAGLGWWPRDARGSHDENRKISIDR